MNPYQLHQYQPFMGGPVRPSFGVSPSPSALDALFQDLTRRQILDAFGGQASPGILDMLINGGAQQAMASAAQPAAAAPAAAPTPEETIMTLTDGRNDGYDAGSLYGGDGYGLYGMAAPAGPSVTGSASGGYGAGLSQEAAAAMGLQEASSTHGGGPSGPSGKGG